MTKMEKLSNLIMLRLMCQVYSTWLQENKARLPFPFLENYYDKDMITLNNLDTKFQKAIVKHLQGTNIHEILSCASLPLNEKEKLVLKHAVTNVLLSVK